MVVYKTDAPINFRQKVPMVSGHKSTVLDLDFSPFHDDLLATASKDCTLKLWEIPPDGLTANMTQCAQDMQGHTKQVGLLKWHPTADHTLASGSNDGMVKVWDVSTGADSMTVDIGAQPYSLKWSHNGALLAAATRDKKLVVVDPRQPDAAQVGTGHLGNKPQRACWMGDTGELLTVGASEFNERCFTVHDSRMLQAPIVSKKLDNNNQPMQAHFDSDNNILYLVNKGSTKVQFFFLNRTSGTPDLTPMDTYAGKDNQIDWYFLGKRCVDINKNELCRGIRLTIKTAQHVSFTVPKKGPGFSPDIYPPYTSDECGSSFSNWAAG
jgi:coronin-1B/1C/6